MERVQAIGGFFFRAHDPQGLAEWYRDNLGVDLVPTDYAKSPWCQQAGPTAFAPFAWDTSYFGRPEQSWMINFRVANLTAMVAQLEASGTSVEVDSETYLNGRFARTTDPEGNPIQLWEPI